MKEINNEEAIPLHAWSWTAAHGARRARSFRPHRRNQLERGQAGFSSTRGGRRTQEIIRHI